MIIHTMENFKKYVIEDSNGRMCIDLIMYVFRQTKGKCTSADLT